MTNCPYVVPEDSWIDKPISWPGLEYLEVLEYLINTPGLHTREAMKSRSMKFGGVPYNYFISGWVRTIFLLENLPSSIVFLKAKVLPSQRLSDDPHLPWVAINKKDNAIVTAHCTCMAGLGESCSHIAAVLFKIEAAVRCGYTRSSCTDEACKWNNDFVSKIHGAPISEIRFFTEQAMAKARCQKRPRMDIDVELDKESFLASLGTLQKPQVVLSRFSQYCDKFIPQKSAPSRVKVPLVIENESKAIEKFREIKSSAHSGLDISKCGFRCGGKNCFVGATPDGIVTCSCHPPSLLEVKCPFSVRECESVQCAILEGKSQFCLDGDGKIRKSHRYYTQVQLQMFVFEMQICHFVVWTPKWVHIVEVKKDDQYISTVLVKLEEFYLRHILPEILTRKLENRSDISVTNSSVELLCSCQKPYDDTKSWIGCDSVSCKYKWFHLTCAKVTRIPKGNWYCRECRATRITK